MKRTPMEMSAPIHYFHGGPAGRQRGANLLPPCITKVKGLADYGADGVCRRDRVYVTTDQRAALMYAAGHHKGVIYRVKPLGPLEDDPDCLLPGLSYQCERAAVLGIIKPSREDIEMARLALMTA